MPSLKSINAQAGTKFKRWKELTDAVTIPWHPQVHRRTAEKAGLTPADFTWLSYPVSHVWLEPMDSQYQPLVYHARVPADTPQLNMYERDERYKSGDQRGWRKIPDPKGSALYQVKFMLIDLADFAVLHEAGNHQHENGHIEAGLSEARGALIWKRLTSNVTIRVRLDAVPLFFPYNNPDTGDGGNHYATANNGYLGGDFAVSPQYRLTLHDDGKFSLVQE